MKTLEQQQHDFVIGSVRQSFAESKAMHLTHEAGIENAVIAGFEAMLTALNPDSVTAIRWAQARKDSAKS